MCERFGLMDTMNSLAHLISCWNLTRIAYGHHRLIDTTGLWTPQTLSHISFHAEISWELLMDTTNSLTHLVSCWNLMRIGLKTPHCGVRKFWSRHCGVHKPELSQNLILCHVTYISTNQNALNFKISRENVRFHAIFFHLNSKAVIQLC